jgi:adhesin HecA-like repeat protein/predicted outer membrane repeat protein
LDDPLNRTWRVYVALTCALALALGIQRELERAQAQPLAGIIWVTSAADGVAEPLNCLPAPAPSCRLRDALSAASYGDYIRFFLPDDSVIVLTEGELVVDRALTIIGADSSNVAVSGNNLSRVFAVGAPLAVVSLTIEYGNTDGPGGGLATNSPVVLHRVAFLTNTAASHGGGLYAESTVELSNTTFISNTSITANGGGAYFLAAATVSGGAFERNAAPQKFFADFGQGGGLWAGGTLDLTGTQFLSNTAGFQGGGVHAVTTTTLVNAAFIANQAVCPCGGAGGGLRALGPLTLSHVQFVSNLAVGSAGGLLAYMPPVLTDTQFLSNTTASFQGGGGAFFATGATLNGAEFHGNTCTWGNCTNGAVFGYSGPGTLALSQNVTTGDDFDVWGDWVNHGTFVQTAGTTTFYSYFAQSLTGGGSTTFHHLHIAPGFGAASGVSLSANINVSGNFTDTGRFIPDGGSVTLNGTQAQRIVGSVPTTFGDLAIANSGAGVSLGQDITVTNRLTLTSDLSTTTGYTLFLNANATGAGNGDVWGRTVRAHPFSLGTTYAFGNPFVSLNFASGAPPSAVTLDLTPTLPANAINTVRRVYAVEPVGGSGYAARLRLHYRDSELNGNQEGALQLWHYPAGGPWTAHPVSGFDSADNWVQTDGVSALSLWTLSQFVPIRQRLYLPFLRR